MFKSTIVHSFRMKDNYFFINWTIHLFKDYGITWEIGSIVCIKKGI